MRPACAASAIGLKRAGIFKAEFVFIEMHAQALPVGKFQIEIGRAGDLLKRMPREIDLDNEDQQQADEEGRIFTA